MFSFRLSRNKRWLVPAVIALHFVLLSHTAFATPATSSQGDSIMLGSIRLTLGMSEAYVTRQLSTQFELKDHWEAGPSSVWRVCDKGGAEQPCLGSVSFEKGKLFEAVRRWRQDGTPAELARLLNAIVARFIAEGNTSCRLDTVKLRDRFSTDESSLIICGHKQIRIGFVTSDPDAKPYVVEVLSEVSAL